jgi:peptide/nickel transport system substrate-binding protein
MKRVSQKAAGRLVAVAVLVVTGGLLLAAAGAAAATTASPSASSSDKVVYRYGTLEYVDNLNPFIGYSGVDYMIYQENYDFLVGFEPEKLQPRPEFAESWSASADGKTWTFKTRPDQTWQDGEPATARDVAFTFNYIIKNELANFLSYTTYIDKVTATDDTTVVFECSKPKGDILSMKVPILPEHIWSKVSAADAEGSFTNGPPCIGSGPFQVTEHKQNDYTRLVANPNYVGGRPKIDEILVVTYQNADTMVQDLKSGMLDGCIGVPPAQFPGLASNTITTAGVVSWSFEQITFNCYDSPDSKGNPVLLDPAFRQALNYAIDRESNAATAYSGHMDPSGVLLPPYSAYYWEPPADQAYTYDPAKAKEMLDAAGYKDVNGDGLRETKDGKALTLRLITDSGTPENVSTSKLAVGWFKDVGVKVKLQIIDAGAIIDATANYEGDTFAPDFDMVLWWWQGDADPQFILSLLTEAQIGGWSDTNWVDPEYEALYLEQSTAVDPAVRTTAIQRMQEIAYTSSPYLIFGYFQFLEAYDSAKWTNYIQAPGGYEGYTGGVFNRDTWTQIQPATAEAPTSESSNTWVWVVVVAVLVVIAIAVVLLLRRRGPEVE